jgi:hypothetical protein
MIQLPKGKYYIGDPCYAFPNHDKWMELLDASKYFSEACLAELDDEKIRVWAGPTAYGDGTYMSSLGIALSVDAGLIGIMPVESLEYLGVNLKEMEFYGTFVEFKNSFCVTHVDGFFEFGHVTVDTACEPDDEDNVYDDDDYDDDDDDVEF